MPIPKDFIKRQLWIERQRIAQKGRKQPASQIKKRQETRLLNHPKILTPCANCGKLTYHIPSRRKERNYCSICCQMDFEYANGIRDKKTIALKANEATRELVAKGLCPLQRPEVRLKGHQILGYKNYGKTWIEEKMGWALAKIGLKAIPQYPIECNRDSWGRKHYYFVDFALPEIKMVIECDGVMWHKDIKKDGERQNFIESKGWTFLRFSEREIKSNVMDCAYKIREQLPVV